MCTTRAAASVLVLLALAAVATAEYYVRPQSPPVYVPKPTTKYAPPLPYVPKPTTTYTPKTPSYVPKPNIHIAIDGVVLCKSGYRTYPIQGARVKVVCPVENSYGKPEAVVVVSSNPTDVKGYFFLVPYGVTERVKNLNACKVKLDFSPLSTCKIPTNVNKGVSGAPLSSNYKLLPDKNLKLYTVGPFFFSSPHAPKPGY